jgi:tRNA A-37 threonylcarbamoyl transferase component Bud32
MKNRYAPISVGGYRGWGRGPAASAGFRQRLGTLLEAGGSEGLTPGRDRRVYRITWEGRPYYVKRYAALTLKTRLQFLLKYSKAQRSCRFAQILRQRGILTPPVAAYLQKGPVWGPEELLVTEGIDGRTLRDAATAPMSVDARRALIGTVAAFLATLHDAGVYHGDFSAFNILVQPEVGADPHWRIYLIDLDAIRSVHRISRRRQIKNLDELGRNFTRLAEVSIQDRLRFLSRYAGARKTLPLTATELKLAVCRRTAKRMETYGKHFSPPS